MAEIKTTGGTVFLCDDSDYPYLSQFTWTDNGSGYAHRYVGYHINDKGKPISDHKYMHREIMKAPKGTEIDHINCNSFDNRKENLRFASRSLQCINTRWKLGVSGFRGVHDCKSVPGLKARWHAQIKVKGKVIRGGYFHSPRMAALAYNDLALEHFGPDFRFFNKVFSR